MNRSAKSAARNRGGFTMLEAMLTMTVAAAMLAITITWLHYSMTFASQMKKRESHHRSLTRLSWQLRDDVRGSREVSFENDQRLVLDSAIETTTYTIKGHSILVETVDKVDAEKIQREEFKLSPHSVAAWDQAESPKFVSLTVTRLPETRQPMTDEMTQSRMTESTSQPSTVADLFLRVAPDRWPSVTSATVQQDASEESENEK